MGTAQRGQLSGDGEGCQTPLLLGHSLLTSVSRLVVSEAAKGNPGRVFLCALQPGLTWRTRKMPPTVCERPCSLSYKRPVEVRTKGGPQLGPEGPSQVRTPAAVRRPPGNKWCARPG
ncbi:hypothetical protein E2C01_074745 [Portunus trituberculatus]|uniref:Uncharacterized protein n=1 Tax=Portunus trituberculatus TaxID=210409 RepID=A0A5B7ID81_PORTR|nr:hypothetical protein [Portunus trituberculatus]